MCPFVWRDLNQILWCMKWFKQIAMVMYDVFTSQAHEWCLPQPVPGENASNLSEEAKLAGNFWSLGLSAFGFWYFRGPNGWGDLCIDVHVMLRWIWVYIYIIQINLQIYRLTIYYIINETYLIDQTFILFISESSRFWCNQKMPWLFRCLIFGGGNHENH